MGQIKDIWPHDLLTFNNVKDFISDVNPLPDWAKDSLSKAKIVVVRRGKIINGKIPVGLRGYERNQRIGGYLAIDNIEKIYHVDYFIKHESWKKLAKERYMMPEFQALIKIKPYLKNYRWGISGSLAYEMATGVKMVKHTPEHNSDLDIIAINFPKISVEKAKEILKQLNQFGTHADVQVVRGEAGFSLEEYANNRADTNLIKTATGPVLSKDPWQALRRFE
ncbi:malonate decarboxylase holo-ACP synthase [uncultured Lactobacillus sp.]|uniref:malonate decarboxylase holo-ACP synthase n=1 Tax=uncultured Lactobacillus sp. TaxID=153152 RepID=UPI002804FBA9|nr:malonate decarboxylase holo-ACP synthase [uncultured Lactobacillus sp.]